MTNADTKREIAQKTAQPPRPAAASRVHEAMTQAFALLGLVVLAVVPTLLGALTVAVARTLFDL